ncbi:hypothetical protein, partial [uncultured Brachyspira sp.]|uniref:hypothetical protein n=1 Tax=uncultured Brachyspira sp. TaxID=221953 RepID=UPI0025CC2A32
RQDKTRQDKTRQDKTDKTRQDKTRQEYVKDTYSIIIAQNIINYKHHFILSKLNMGACND